MFTALLFKITKVWKQPKCPSIDKWIKNTGYIYTVQYGPYETLPLATAWISLEGFMLSEISQTEKDKCHIISFTCGI